MIKFMDPKDNVKEEDKCLDSRLWHACAGGMVQMPPVNSKVFYFPQGHAEHASGPVDFKNSSKIPPLIACRVSAVKFMADPETDEVYSRIRLRPLSSDEHDGEVDGAIDGPQLREKPASFAKTLTQSDANNGGGFSVPRYCAETIFPRLDFTADPPVQIILAKDVHGATWKFRHIYRGTPRRHLLTTGWSTFVNRKKLVAGDSIVFMRTENGDLCVGIRRAKRGIGGGLESEPGWSCTASYGGFSAFLREEENRAVRRNTNGNGDAGDLSCNGGVIGKGKVKGESVVEAVTLASNKMPFEVVYYPRATMPEFCVRAHLVSAALQIRWCLGMRFKMAFETEDSSRISWFMGTISSVQVADPIRWPDSPWRLLQVTWDEPDLLRNVKRVSPWLVELISNFPTINLSPFSSPRKKPRLPQHPDFTLNGQLPMPAFSGTLLGPGFPFGCFTESTPAGMQGARHGQYGLSLPDFQLNRLHPAYFPPPLSSPKMLPFRAAGSPVTQMPAGDEDEDSSCVLTMGNYTQPSKKSGLEDAMTPRFLLFGQPILTEQQLSGGRGDVASPSRTKNSLSSEGYHQEMEHEPETSQCKVFMGPEDMDRNLDLSLLGSYEECKVLMEPEDMDRNLDLSLLGSYEELYQRVAQVRGV